MLAPDYVQGQPWRRAALYRARTRSSQLQGDEYGLAAPRYAFGNGSAVVVGFVHPQNLLPGWAGGETAAGYARILDVFATRYRAREGLAPPTISVERWVDHQLEHMSPGQRSFERIGQFRSLEKRAVANGGAITPFGELVLIWRHIEPYIFAEPEALDPRGELLSGEWHGKQHVATRGTRRELGVPLGGYLEYCDQGHKASSMNVMFDSQNFCVRAFEDDIGHTKIMTDGGKLALGLAEQFNLPTLEPIDLLSGGLFLKCVDISLSDPDSVMMLLRVLQVPVLRRRISVGEPGKGPGTSEQQRVKTQVDVEHWAGFHRLKNAYKLSNLDVAEGRPAVGTPVPCLDAVAYGRVHNDTGHFRL